MGIKRAIIDKTRKNFIKLCTDADVPRMASEVFPSDVRTVKDINYLGDDDKMHLLDVYLPEGVSFEDQKTPRVILDIHGGGFVYGLKEINTCFNMHVARRTGLPVVSVNYTVFPEGSLISMTDEVVSAIRYIKETYKISDLILMGDSAGAFMAFTLWAVLTDKDIRHEYNCFHNIRIDISGLILICPASVGSSRYIHSMEEAYFGEDIRMHIPKYGRDLTELLDKAKFDPPKTLLITSDQDGMHDDTVVLYDALKARGIDARLFDGVTKEGGNPLFHVYVVGHPDWPESDEPLHMIEDLVVQ